MVNFENSSRVHSSMPAEPRLQFLKGEVYTMSIFLAFPPSSCLFTSLSRNSYHTLPGLLPKSAFKLPDTPALPWTLIPCPPPSMWERTHIFLLCCISMAPGDRFIPTIPEIPWELGLLQYIEICVSPMPGSVWVPNVLVSIW